MTSLKMLINHRYSARRRENSYSATWRRGKETTAAVTFLQQIGSDLKKGMFSFSPQLWALSLRWSA